MNPLSFVTPDTMMQFVRSPYFYIVLVWELFWKGKALWRAVKNEQMNWFIAILIVNSVGILPIIYLNFFQKKHHSK